MITQENCLHAISHNECNTINQKTNKPYKRCIGVTCRCYETNEDDVYNVN